MTSVWNILHVTDFHVSNPNGPDEPLRHSYLNAYVKGLATAIREALGQIQIDAVVITGDMVDKGGNTESHKHVGKIISTIADEISLPWDQVYLCPGNHDVVRELDKTGDIAGARKNYMDLAQQFGNKMPLWESQRGMLFRIGDSALFFSLDSTLGSNGEDCSGNIDAAEIDEIANQVTKFQLKDQLLIVASHHPPAVDEPILAMCDEQNPDWTKRHLWWPAIFLHSTLSKHAVGPVLWLSGELHKGTHSIRGKMHTVVTGRFGTVSSINNPTQVFREARVVQIPADGESKSWVFEYRPSGHRDQVQDGEWIALAVEPTKTLPGRRGLPRLNSTPPVDHQHHGITDEALAVKPPSAPSPIYLLSTELQEEILSIVSREKLYSLGRFVTSTSRTSLSWIPVGALLDKGELLVATIGTMAGWVRQQFKNLPSERLGFVGIDSWGAVLASQISVMIGAKNYCIAARAEGITHSESERISASVVTGLFSCEVLVLVSDVIGTGKSLRYVFDNLESGFRKYSLDNQINQRERTWVILSVICDGVCDRNKTLDFAKFNITACKDLRMPTLHSDELPDESILPPTISFLSGKVG